ncbi:hypothetical protein LEM72_13225 [Psychrobacter aquimaris]
MGLNAEANSDNGVALGQNSTIAEDAPDSVAIGTSNTVTTSNNIQQQIFERRPAVPPTPNDPTPPRDYPTGETSYTGTSVALGSSNSVGEGGGVALGNSNQYCPWCCHRSR